MHKDDPVLTKGTAQGKRKFEKSDIMKNTTASGTNDSDNGDKIASRFTNSAENVTLKDTRIIDSTNDVLNSQNTLPGIITNQAMSTGDRKNNPDQM